MHPKLSCIEYNKTHTVTTGTYKSKAQASKGVCIIMYLCRSAEVGVL